MKVAELTFEEFLNYKTEWCEALERSGDNHIFLTWEWLSTWWKHFGGERRFSLITVSDDEKLIAAAPLMSSKYKLAGLKLKKMEFIGTPAADYQTFLLADKKTECAKLIMDYASNKTSSWDCIEFKDVPEDSETIKILKTCSRKKLEFEERNVNICPYIILPNRFEDYFQELGPNWRRNMRRWGKKLKNDYRVNFYIHNDLDTLDEAMETFFNLHQIKWQSQKHAGVFSDQRFHDFHLEVAKSFAERGWLNLCFLAINDEPVSAIYAFKYRNKMFNYLTGFDPKYSEYRLGHLLFLYSIKNSIEHGLTEFDFMRGDETYKRRWNTLIRNNLEVRAIKKRIVPIVYDIITKKNMFTPLATTLGKRVSFAPKEILRKE
jgi:CelD/BcsL family acetyltransferase involved in cellulose biosynthesis